MSSRSTCRAAAHRLSLALVLALATMGGSVACADPPTAPQPRSTEGLEPRLDGSDGTDAESDTTETLSCNHTQGWGCA